MGIKLNQAKSLETYICLACCLRNRTKYPIEEDTIEFKWNVYEKITILKFYELYDLGNNILINLQ